MFYSTAVGLCHTSYVTRLDHHYVTVCVCTFNVSVYLCILCVYLHNLTTFMIISIIKHSYFYVISLEHPHAGSNSQVKSGEVLKNNSY